jgi:Ni/Fe-hydrogenase subunit HybB-like protein
VAVGLAMTIFESFMSLRAFGKHLEMDLLAGMAKAMVVVLAVYATLKAVDFNSRHAWKFVFTPNKEAYFFWLEITVGVLLPMILLANEKVRTHRQGLFYSAVMVILGFVINRMNVSITGWEGASRNYFPHWMEWAVTMSIIGVAFLLFALAVRYLPIFNKDELEEKSALERFPYLQSQTQYEPKAIAN